MFKKKKKCWTIHSMPRSAVNRWRYQRLQEQKQNTQHEQTNKDKGISKVSWGIIEQHIKRYPTG